MDQTLARGSEQRATSATASPLLKEELPNEKDGTSSPSDGSGFILHDQLAADSDGSEISGVIIGPNERELRREGDIIIII